MSKYLEGKVDLEAQFAALREEFARRESELRERERENEKVRDEELEAEIEDIRKRVIAFGIPAEKIFPELKHRGSVASKRRPRTPPERRAPARFKDPTSGQTWSGDGKWPTFFRTLVLDQGVDPKTLLVEGASLPGTKLWDKYR